MTTTLLLSICLRVPAGLFGLDTFDLCFATDRTGDRYVAAVDVDDQDHAFATMSFATGELVVERREVTR